MKRSIEFTMAAAIFIGAAVAGPGLSQVRVAAGDVNGDGRADAAPNSGAKDIKGTEQKPAALLVPAVQKVREAANRQRAAYLKFDGVKGESSSSQADHDHKDWIPIESFSFGDANMTACSGGGGAGKVMAKAQTAVPAGKRPTQRLPTVAMDIVQNDGSTLKVTLTDVLVSSATAAPTEQMSLNYTKITWAHTPCSTRTASTGR